MWPKKNHEWHRYKTCESEKEISKMSVLSDKYVQISDAKDNLEGREKKIINSN